MALLQGLGVLGGVLAIANAAGRWILRGGRVARMIVAIAPALAVYWILYHVLSSVGGGMAAVLDGHAAALAQRVIADAGLTDAVPLPDDGAWLWTNLAVVFPLYWMAATWLPQTIALVGGVLCVGMVMAALERIDRVTRMVADSAESVLPPSPVGQ